MLSGKAFARDERVHDDGVADGALVADVGLDVGMELETVRPYTFLGEELDVFKLEMIRGEMMVMVVNDCNESNESNDSNDSNESNESKSKFAYSGSNVHKFAIFGNTHVERDFTKMLPENLTSVLNSLQSTCKDHRIINVFTTITINHQSSFIILLGRGGQFHILLLRQW